MDQRYAKYGPYVCIGILLVIIFALWKIWGDGAEDFQGLEISDKENKQEYPLEMLFDKLVVPGPSEACLNLESHETIEPPGLNRTQVCKQIIEEITGVEFSEAIIEFDESPGSADDNRVYLDIYNDGLHLAIECEQFMDISHPSGFSTHESSSHKMGLCADANIRLIVIPHLIGDNDIKRYLSEQLNNPSTENF